MFLPLVFEDLRLRLRSRDPFELQQAEKNACGSAFTLRANLPFFRLHPSFAPFLFIPIETKEMNNGNRRKNHTH
jgi:hypothetical protein